MTGRLPFFERVDEVLKLMDRYQQKKLSVPKPEIASHNAVGLTRLQASVWEPLVVQLLTFDVEVLEYTVGMLKARENLVGRRMSSLLGASRGNGMLGVLLSAFALATVFNFLASMLPGVPKLWFLTGFVALTAFMSVSGFLLLTAGHEASQLLTYVSLLEAVIALKKAEPAGLSLPLTFSSPAEVVRPGAQKQVKELSR